MRALVIISCVATLAAAQFQPGQFQSSLPQLKETHHIQALQQPHLPQDPNVVDATATFLRKFSQLKALADAAPDPRPTQPQRQRFDQPTRQPAPQRFAPQPAAPQRFAPQPAAPQRFAPQPAAPHRFAPQPAAQPSTGEFDVTREISQLLAAHKAANPTPAPPSRRQQFRQPAPVQQRAPPPQHRAPPQQPLVPFQQTRAPVQQHRAPVQQHRAPVQQHRAPVQQQAFPTFDMLNNLGTHQQPQQVQQTARPRPRPIDPNVPITNTDGHVINPLQYPGPLAHTVPAGVAGEVQNPQFTPEVAQAQRDLAAAHASILRQQSGLF